MQKVLSKIEAQTYSGPGKAGTPLVLSFFFLLLLAFSFSQSPASAKASDLEIKNSKGEELRVENPLLGKKRKFARDRFGNELSETKGLFGGKKRELNLFGNKIKSRKGLLGGTEFEARTIYGDQLKTKKGLFTRRKTKLVLR